MTRVSYVVFIISMGSIQCGLAFDFSDSFDSPHDFIAQDVANSGWHGLENRQPAHRVNASQEHAGQLLMAASDSSSTTLGALLYLEVNSDFTVSVQVTDFAGTQDAPVPGVSGGLLVRASSSTPQHEQWIALDYSPVSSHGNGIREARGETAELSCTNSTMWNAQPYLQIERVGRLIFLRTSSDRSQWQDLPCSPVIRNDLVGQTLQVGLYSANSPEGQSYIAFDDFYLSDRPEAGARPMQAYDPTPAHNTNDILYSVLSWEPGLIAVAHDVWLGTSRSNLSLIGQSLPRNETTLFYGASFEPGTTYYWRVDEITSIQSTVTGDLWTFSVPDDQAFVPYPQDGQIDVIENHLTLTWAPGRRAIWHDVYFSQNLTHVQNQDSQAFQGRSTRSGFTPAALKGQTTYYWRVNEIELDGQTHHVGPVWSFTTMASIPVLDSSLRALWTWDEGQGITAADSSGFRHHARILGDPLWVNGVLGTAIELDGMSDYAIASGDNLPTGDSDFTVCAWIQPYVHSHTLLAWGTDQANRGQEIRLVQGNLCRHSFWGNHATFDTGSLVDEWHHLVIGSDGFERRAYVDGEEVPALPGSDPLGIPNVSPGDVILGANPWASNDKYHGLLDEVRIYNVNLKTPAIRDLYMRAQWQASEPFPEDKHAVDALSHLSWKAQGSDLAFDVYFGQDEGWVRTASTSDQSGTYLGRFQGPSADISLPSGVESTYFWRVDTRAGNITTKGHVWSFHMIKSLLIDGFETYTESSPYRLYQTWVDGVGFTDPPPGQPGNGSNAIVGYDGAPYTENSVVYSGNQAMPLRFQNVNAPHYSEASRLFDVRENWISSDYHALSLSFYGPQANLSLPSEFLYVTLTDSQGRSSTVQHSGPVSQYSDAQWHNWKIAMNGFTSVDLSDIAAISMGMGDRSATIAGSDGILYIDAVRLTSAF
ncbi:MAG: hypothetical protein GY809_30170 [Planctomycetes bacterium]|nr:hypothetical protein [Planctomycetota bacterium]